MEITTTRMHVAWEYGMSYDANSIGISFDEGSDDEEVAIDEIDREVVDACIIVVLLLTRLECC